VIHKIVFADRNLTSNAGLFLLLENAKANEIFDLINTGLVFDHPSTNKIQMNLIKTMLCGHFIGSIDWKESNFCKETRWLKHLGFR
jgi:hypothetical protein